MASLRSLTEELDVGDHIAWVGSKADVGETVRPKQVTDINDDGDTIRVDAEGVRGGRYFYRVDETGTREAFFCNPNMDTPVSMGEIIFAELTATGDRVRVKRGYHDSR